MKNYNIIIKRNLGNIIPISQIKNYLRVIHDEDDTLLQQLTSSAIDIAEKILNQYLGKCEIELTIQDNYSSRIILPILPFIEITQIKAGEKALEKEKYHTDINTNTVIFKCDYWVSKMTINYIAGFDPVPFAIKQGIFLHIAYMYDCKSTVVPQECMNMYKLYRRISI